MYMLSKSSLKKLLFLLFYVSTWCILYVYHDEGESANVINAKKMGKLISN